jgi:uncharacterized protein with NRDE domain
MHLWSEKNIIAGKDLKAGGTWLGVTSEKINNTYKFSALTNYRQKDAQQSESMSGAKVTPPSRGELVIKALTEEPPILNSYLQSQSHHYQGFNLIHGDVSADETQLFCFASKQECQHKLTAGFHSICNGALDDIWPKMARGKNLLEDYVKQTSDIDVERLFSLMQDNTVAPDELLPCTGIPLEWEKKLSSIFIKSSDYGTRSTTILTLDTDNTMQLYQKEYNALGLFENEITFLR